MNYLSSSKYLTSVVFLLSLLVPGVSLGAAREAKISRGECGRLGGSFRADNQDIKAADQKEADSGTCSIENADAQACKNAALEKNKARQQFMNYCKGDEDGAKSVSECMSHLDTCSSLGQSEQSFASIGAVAGMPELAGIMGSGSQGACSKYTQDKLDSLIDKKQSELDRKQEKELEAAKKQVEDEEKYEEKKQQLTEDFLKQQEEKAEAELKSKEDDRNQAATFEKQQQEYQQKIRQINDEVFALQKAQQLLIKKRQLDIANLKGVILAAKLKCNAEVKQAISGLNPKAGKSGSLGGAQSQIGDAQQLYLACMDEKTSKRIQDAEQFKVDMEKFDRQINNKTAELAEIRTSMETMSKMFEQAKADAETKKQKDEESFMKKQIAKWQELLSLDNNMAQKRIKNAEAIAKAKSSTMTASNSLIRLQMQEPLGAKSSETIKSDYIANYTAQIQYIKDNCDQKLLTPSEKNINTETAQ